MLDSLRLDNFTVFTSAQFQFARNLNVIVGENGVGKTHVLKAAYSAIAVSSRGRRDLVPGTSPKTYLQRVLAEKLVRVFRPNELGRLAQRLHGNARCNVACAFDDPALDFSFSFHTRSKSEVAVDEAPRVWEDTVPVFFPTRELLSIYPGFVSLYETTELAFDETYRDTCLLLGAPLARGPRLTQIKKLLQPLEAAMGGTIDMDKSGRFYLTSKMGTVEIPLVAEGLRKLAMVARLIATGSLLDKGYLFWDEPEANLNPRVIRLIAQTILDLCQTGVQVFIATHSLFLLRELEILLQAPSYQAVDARWFGLHSSESGVIVDQGDSVSDIGDIASLDEELIQSDRYMEADEK